MTLRSTLWSCRQSKLFLSHLLLLTIIVTSFGTAFAQTPADIVTRLRSLRLAQSDALRCFQYFYEQRAPTSRFPGRNAGLGRSTSNKSARSGSGAIPPRHSTRTNDASGLITYRPPTTSGLLNTTPRSDQHQYHLCRSRNRRLEDDDGGEPAAPPMPSARRHGFDRALIPAIRSSSMPKPEKDNFSGDSHYGCGALVDGRRRKLDAMGAAGSRFNERRYKRRDRRSSDHYQHAGRRHSFGLIAPPTAASTSTSPADRIDVIIRLLPARCMRRSAVYPAARTAFTSRSTPRELNDACRGFQKQRWKDQSRHRRLSLRDALCGRRNSSATNSSASDHQQRQPLDPAYGDDTPCGSQCWYDGALRSIRPMPISLFRRHRAIWSSDGGASFITIVDHSVD